MINYSIAMMGNPAKKQDLRCGSVHREITSFAITILLKHLDYSILFSIFAACNA